jgi:hypothetical protein
MNEAHDLANIFDYSQEQLVELTALMCDTAREANPEVIRVVNIVWEWAQYVATGKYNSLEGSRESPSPLMSPSQYFERCIEADVQFEVVGLQVHNPARDMLEISLMLDRYSRFGRPIHITELGVPSAPVPERSERANWPFSGTGLWGHPYSWHEPLSEDVQADWYEQFFTLCYSKPQVTAVTTWMWEDGGHELSLTKLLSHVRGGRPAVWPLYTGFLRADLTPKPSYFRLKKLIDSWESQKI